MPEWGQSVLGKHVDKFRRGTAFACVVPPRRQTNSRWNRQANRDSALYNPPPGWPVQQNEALQVVSFGQRNKSRYMRCGLQKADMVAVKGFDQAGQGQGSCITVQCPVPLLASEKVVAFGACQGSILPLLKPTELSSARTNRRLSMVEP